MSTSRFNPNDRVVIGDGPLRGSVGRLLRFDPDSNTAQIRIWLTAQGRERPALTVATLSLLRAYDEHPDLVAAGTPAAPKRGRPRKVTDEILAEIHAMYRSGRYSRAEIADRLAVSKSTVSYYLRDPL